MISSILLAVITTVAALPKSDSSNWQYVPSVMLENVLMPAPEADGLRQESTVIGTGSVPIRAGITMLYTNARLDRIGAGGARNSTYWRCYEFFNADFSQSNTRCFVLKPPAQ